MMDGAGKWWEIFKDNVKVNPFEIFVYAKNIINRNRPFRSAVMLLALAGGMAGGAALFLTVETINAWSLSILSTLIPNAVLAALDGIAGGLSDIFMQICVGVFGAYIGNGVAGTVVKQTWRALNKALFGTTNSLYDLTVGDMDAIRENNPEDFDLSEHPELEDNWDRLRYKLIEWIPMHWMPTHGLLTNLVPEAVHHDRKRIWDLIQFLREKKKNHKHDGTGRDGDPKFALTEMINHHDASSAHRYLEELQGRLQGRNHEANYVQTTARGYLGESPNLQAPLPDEVDDSQRSFLQTAWSRFKAHLNSRTRYTIFNRESAHVNTLGHLNEIANLADREMHEVGQSLIRLDNQLAIFKPRPAV